MSGFGDIGWDNTHQLFSIVLCIDASMTVLHASATLQKFMPRAQAGSSFPELFEVQRPSHIDSFEAAKEHLGALCLLTATDRSFAIRGQFVAIERNGVDTLCFFGSPWLFWINSNRPEVGLGLEDFSSQDVQLDQLFFMSTEKRMVADLEKLNAELQEAKTQLEEAQDAQRLFFAQMSHEIRTPLNGVVSALSLLDESATDDRQSQLVRLAQSSSRNLMQVINYVLSLSKLELGDEEKETAFSFPALAREAMDVVRARADEKKLALKLELAADLPAACYGNPARLRQTMLNLLINGIKFTERGSVTLRAMTTTRAEGEPLLRVEVIDTGIGIRSEALTHIFKPFWSSLREGGARHEDGTGLGLDIVRRNVESMGGAINVTSTPGQGTRFWFELPLAEAPHDEVRAVDRRRQGPAAPALSGKVLLVDDNETNLLLGSLILESLGLVVTSVDGGAAAVAAVQDSTFDLVLMDISMPAMDGLEATRRIRRFADSTALPILALSAHIDSAQRRECLDNGMNGYLTKPVARDQLARELAPWLGAGSAGEPEQAADFAAPAVELVDRQVLQDLVGQIGEDNLAVVLDKVQAEAALRWGELEQATQQQDSAAMQRHVHSLASIFRSVGLMTAGDSLREIESCLRAGDVPAAGWLPELEQLKTASLAALARQSPAAG